MSLFDKTRQSGFEDDKDQKKINSEFGSGILSWNIISSSNIVMHRMAVESSQSINHMKGLETVAEEYLKKPFDLNSTCC